MLKLFLRLGVILCCLLSYHDAYQGSVPIAKGIKSEVNQKDIKSKVMKLYDLEEVFKHIMNDGEIYLTKVDNGKNIYFIIKESLYASKKLWRIAYSKKPLSSQKILQKDLLYLDDEDYYSFAQIKRGIAKHLDRYLSDGFTFITFDEILDKEIPHFKKSHQVANSITYFEQKKHKGFFKKRLIETEYKKITYYPNRVVFEMSGVYHQSGETYYRYEEGYFVHKEDISELLKGGGEYDQSSYYYENLTKVDAINEDAFERYKRKTRERDREDRKELLAIQNLFEKYPKMLKALESNHFQYPDREIVIKNSLELENYMDHNDSEFYNKMVIIDGDLIVKNNIIIQQSDLIVLGDVKAKNLLFTHHDLFLHIVGDTNVRELIITHCKNKNFCSGSVHSTYFATRYIHTAKSNNYITSKIMAPLITEENAIPFFDPALYRNKKATDWRGRRVTQLIFSFDTLIEKLQNNKRWTDPAFSISGFLKEKEIRRQKQFIRNSAYPLLYLYKDGYVYAGFERYSNEVTIKAFGGYPEHEVYIEDIRGKTGIVEYHHEGTREYMRKNKSVAKKIGVSPLELLGRVEGLSSFYSQRVVGNLFDFSPNVEERYRQEKAFFSTDPFLALFWYMFFTAVDDERVGEIEPFLEQAEERKKLGRFKRVWEYFKVTKAQIKKDGYFIPYIHPKNDDEVKINRQIKANFLANKYEHLHLMYPEKFEYLIKTYEYPWRDTLLKALQIFKLAGQDNHWQILSRELKHLSERRLGVLFLQTFNPENNITKQDAFLGTFLDKLETSFQKELWKIDTGTISEYLYLLKDRVPPNLQKKYKALVDFYFESQKTTKMYIEIQEALGIEVDSDIEIINQALEQIDKEIEKLGPSNKMTSQDMTLRLISIEPIFNRYLEKYSARVLFKIIHNLKAFSAKQRALIYLINHDIKDKKETMVWLWMRVAFADYDVPKFFSSTFPYVIDEQSENLEVIKEILNKNSDDFKSKYRAEDAYEMAYMLLLSIAHKEKVFDFIIESILRDKDKKSIKNKVLLENLFHRFNESESINASLSLSKIQIEKLLDSVWELLVESIKHEVNNGARSGLRMIYNMTSPLAKEWLELKLNLNNQGDMHQAVKNKKNGLKIIQEVNRNLANGLEEIKHSHSFLLVKKDNNRYQFFEYFVYGDDEGGFGRVIYEGSWQDNIKWNNRYNKENKNEKQFKNKEQMLKERKETIEQKLTEGFKDFYHMTYMKNGVRQVKK